MSAPLLDLLDAVVSQPNVSPAFKKALTGPVYYEKLDIELANPLRDKLDDILDLPRPTALDELERLINHEILDKASKIVGRLQSYKLMEEVR